MESILRAIVLGGLIVFFLGLTGSIQYSFALIVLAVTGGILLIYDLSMWLVIWMSTRSLKQMKGFTAQMKGALIRGDYLSFNQLSLLHDAKAKKLDRFLDKTDWMFPNEGKE